MAAKNFLSSIFILFLTILTTFYTRETCFIAPNDLLNVSDFILSQNWVGHSCSNRLYGLSVLVQRGGFPRSADSNKLMKINKSAYGFRSPYVKCSSNILCLHTFLLLCGDISTNPGPVRHPCGACSKPVRANQHGLQCESCDTWSHRVCVNMTKPEYQRLGNSWESWFCETCLLSQFTDSFFSVDQSINSSYLPSTTNSTLHEDSVLNISGNTTEGSGEENYDPFMELRKVRHKHKNNVLVSYLNINSLRYKLTEISDVLYDKLTDIYVSLRKPS